MKGCGFMALILFGVLWSAMTLLFDGFILVPAVRQVNALRFPITDGIIRSSA